ncbi:MAG: ATP-binding protein [Verrucomicrobia bacterium]|nr:ATP-binding protein [Verrucomicrobiota bacterium]MDA1068123.1 ATP-binding protein [Verrucomicrobiota bacterium]
MIKRALEAKLVEALSESPAVALLGSRQVGKTTLALGLSKKSFNKDIVYLDLELDSDLAKFSDAEAYLGRLENKLVIIDEAQRAPELFRLLRGLIDVRKRKGEKAAQFLLLGSASRDLLQQTSESLAGRIRFLELSPFTVEEVKDSTFDLERLWLRGGYPDSFLANSEDASWDWRINFISTYLERDIPLMGPKVPAARMKRFWTMLAHVHGQQLNLSNLGKSLETSHTTIRNYLDLLTDFYMIRQIPPWAGNTKKRLVKAPKVYIRDSGLLHTLLNTPDLESLLGHPILGASWEGFVVENILSRLSSKWCYSYYRTSAQAELDLVLEGPLNQRVAIDIKRSVAPKITKGYHFACEDLKATQKVVIYAGTETFPISGGIEAMGIKTFLNSLDH